MTPAGALSVSRFLKQERSWWKRNRYPQGHWKITKTWGWMDAEASKKKSEITVYFNLYGDTGQSSSKPKFKVGDNVRISKYQRKVFDKGYTPNWTEEIFLVDKIESTNPITYRLKDLNNEEIQGNFYEPELVKAKQGVFRIDKVIRRDCKKKQSSFEMVGL